MIVSKGGLNDREKREWGREERRWVKTTLPILTSKVCFAFLDKSSPMTILITVDGR